jgi:hypothetical protein
MTKVARALFGLVALGALTGSCHKGTYLELVFKAQGLPAVNHILVGFTLADGRVSVGSLPEKPAAGNVVTFPSSAAFQLDNFSGAMTILATAYDETNTQVAQASATTTIMDGKTWTVELNFTAPPAGDAGATDASTPADAASDSLVTITDGSLVDGGGDTCVAATVQASESVSLDYNSSGPSLDSGNLLWANIGPAERTVGWMKFGIRFIPRTARIMKATLNLTMVQATGNPPLLVVDYSSVDGWTRKSKAEEVPVSSVISTGGPYLLPATGMPTPYTLDPNHDWTLDLGASDGTITLGIENTAAAPTALLASKVTFYGVDHVAAVDGTRPTLDLVICPAN